jgi:hypothetical protein
MREITLEQMIKELREYTEVDLYAKTIYDIIEMWTLLDETKEEYEQDS